MKLYVGNLSFQTSEDELRDLFSQHGDVASVSLVMDRETGRPRGFGFVEMGSDAEAVEAVNKLNGSELDGRKIVVSEARPKAQ